LPVVMLSNKKKNNRKMSNIDELQDQLELLSLDKEQLQLEKELVEEELTLLKSELHSLRKNFEGHEVEKEKLLTIVKDLQTDLKTSKLEYHQLEQQLEKMEIQHQLEIKELKQSVDSNNSYDSIIENLASQNLELSLKVNEFRQTITELEETIEISEELDHQQRDQLETNQKRIEELENQVVTLKYQLEIVSDVTMEKNKKMQGLIHDLAMERKSKDEQLQRLQDYENEVNTMRKLFKDYESLEIERENMKNALFSEQLINQQLKGSKEKSQYVDQRLQIILGNFLKYKSLATSQVDALFTIQNGFDVVELLILYHKKSPNNQRLRKSFRFFFFVQSLTIVRFLSFLTIDSEIEDYDLNYSRFFRYIDDLFHQLKVVINGMSESSSEHVDLGEFLRGRFIQSLHYVINFEELIGKDEFSDTEILINEYQLVCREGEGFSDFLAEFMIYFLRAILCQIEDESSENIHLMSSVLRLQNVLTDIFRRISGIHLGVCHQLLPIIPNLISLLSNKEMLLDESILNTISSIEEILQQVVNDSKSENDSISSFNYFPLKYSNIFNQEDMQSDFISFPDYSVFLTDTKCTSNRSVKSLSLDETSLVYDLESHRKLLELKEEENKAILNQHQELQKILIDQENKFSQIQSFQQQQAVKLQDDFNRLHDEFKALEEAHEVLERRHQEILKENKQLKSTSSNQSLLANVQTSKERPQAKKKISVDLFEAAKFNVAGSAVSAEVKVNDLPTFLPTCAHNFWNKMFLHRMTVKLIGDCDSIVDRTVSHTLLYYYNSRISRVKDLNLSSVSKNNYTC
jgi:hypothetical protein